MRDPLIVLSMKWIPSCRPPRESETRLLWSEGAFSAYDTGSRRATLNAEAPYRHLKQNPQGRLHALGDRIASTE